MWCIEQCNVRWLMHTASTTTPWGTRSHNERTVITGSIRRHCCRCWQYDCTLRVMLEWARDFESREQHEGQRRANPPGHRRCTIGVVCIDRYDRRRFASSTRSRCLCDSSSSKMFLVFHIRTGAPSHTHLPLVLPSRTPSHFHFTKQSKHDLTSTARNHGINAAPPWCVYLAPILLPTSFSNIS